MTVILLDSGDFASFNFSC